MTKGKKMYWHIVTRVSPSSEDGHAVGDVIGYEERTTGPQIITKNTPTRHGRGWTCGNQGFWKIRRLW
jgi:hypothetical protein